MHLDAVLPVRSVALVDPAKVLNFESPIAVRDGAPNDSAVFHWRMLSRHYDTDMIWCWRGYERRRHATGQRSMSAL